MNSKAVSLNPPLWLWPLSLFLQLLGQPTPQNDAASDSDLDFDF
jgi:hypothetical protein